MNQENFKLKTSFNEQLIMSSGLNLQIFEDIYVVDLLRLEYISELNFRITAQFFR